MNTRCRRTLVPFISLLAALAGAAGAEVPTYRVEVIATFSTTTVLRGASENGRIVGYQINAGQAQAFTATLDQGMALLPLPAGYNSADALDVNSAGVIVGTASDSGSAADFGQPAVWEPDGAGGYSIRLPRQFDTVNSALGPLPVTGGQVVAINESGTLVGWSRLQGFQGGPATLFSLDGAPSNLSEMGLNATPRDVNDANIVVGGQLKFDLDTAAVTDLGVPPDLAGNVGFTNAIVFAINNAGEAVVAANLASVPTENYLTYNHHEDTGYRRLDENELPSRFVGFYDNNDLGDTVSPAGIYFSAEDALVTRIADLLAPDSAQWDVANGFIDNDRRIYTTAQDFATATSALVVLVPVADVVFEHGFEARQ